jgi:hypothetical protein
MKFLRHILFGFAAVVCMFNMNISVSAHFLQAESGIGGLIHIDPNDDPIIGQVSNIFIDLKDSQNRLTEANCNCTIKILENEQEISSRGVQVIKSEDGQLYVTSQFTFPKKGSYIVRMEGKSTNSMFPDFRLDFDFFVSQKSRQNETDSKQFFWVLSGIGSVLVIVFLALIGKKILTK